MTKQELMDLGLTEENADKVLKEHVPYDRFKQVNDDKKALEGQIADLNKNIGALNDKIKAGEDAEKSISDLKDQLAQKDEQMKASRKDAAIRLALTEAKAKNAKAAIALLDADNLELQEDGTVKGVKEAIEALQKSDGYLFDVEQSKTPPTGGFNPAGRDPGKEPPKTFQDAVRAGLEAQMKG